MSRSITGPSGGPPPAPSAGPRVLHIVNALEVGGAELILLALLPGLRDAGVDASLLTLKEPREIDDEMRARGVPVSHLGLEGVSTLSRTLDLSRIIRRLAPQVVHTHLFISDCIGGWAARAVGQRTIVSTRYDDGSWMRRRHRFLERATFPLFSRLVSVSSATRDALLARGAPQGRVGVLPHSTVSAADLNERRHVTLPDSADAHPILCTLGRLVAVKGTMDLIQAAARLRPRYPRLEVWIIGTGPERSHLESEAEALGIADAVRFWGRQEDPFPFLARSDLFILTSRSEGLPMVILEAMAAGKPIVATAVGGVPEVISDGITGLLVPPRDVSALTAAIDRLLGDPAEASALGARAREQFLRQHTAAAMISAYIDLYRDLVPSERTAP